MHAAAQLFSADPARLKDEALVLLAQTGEHRGAVRVLLLRHRWWVNRYVARRLRQMRTGAIEVEDAQQEAVFGILRAIARYDLRQVGRLRRCSFRTFLNLTIRGHVTNLIRRHLRVEIRYDRSFPAADLLDA